MLWFAALLVGHLEGLIEIDQRLTEQGRRQQATLLG